MASRRFGTRWSTAIISKRRLLRQGALGGAGLAGAFLLACSGSDNDDSTSSTATGADSGATSAGGQSGAEPKRGGDLFVAHSTEEPPNLDAINGTSTTFHNLLGIFYNGLLRFDPQVSDASVIQGDLAQSYEVISPTEFRFALPDGATWHDGRPVTSEDVRFTFELYKESAGHKGEALAGVTQIAAPDARTVTITANRPRASMLPWLSINSMNVGPAHLLQGDPKALEKKVMGSGPFKFDRYEPGVAISGVRNPQYFKDNLPYLNSIEYLIIPDENARLGALRSGQIAMLTRLKLAQAETVQSEEIVVQSSAAMSNGIVGGHVDKAPFTDPRVRQAISLAVDRQAALKVILDGDGVIGSPIFSPQLARSQEELLQLPGYDATKKAEDITRAKQLLAAAGFPSGFRTTITTRSGHPQYEAVAVFAVDQLKLIGIDATIKAVENAVLTQLRNAGDFEMLVAAGTSYIADPSGTTNYWGPEARDFPVKDAKIAQLLDQVESEFDVPKRRQLVRDLELALVEWAPYVQTFWSNEHDALSTEVKGYTKMIGLFGNARHEGVWLDG